MHEGTRGIAWRLCGQEVTTSRLGYGCRRWTTQPPDPKKRAEPGSSSVNGAGDIDDGSKRPHGRG